MFEEVGMKRLLDEQIRNDLMLLVMILMIISPFLCLITGLTLVAIFGNG